MTARLALLGVPGAGKSVVGELLARAWDCPILDTDEIYAQRHGESAADAVITDEAAFRREEEGIVLESLHRDGCVVVVGSGAIASPRVQQMLQECPAVWLDIPAAEAAHRNGLSAIRPPGLGNVRAQFFDMLQQRAGQYDAVADLRVPVGSRDITDVADEIIAWEATDDAND